VTRALFAILAVPIWLIVGVLLSVWLRLPTVHVSAGSSSSTEVWR